ncbi:hypothetical protein [Nakamurella leprariae]|uniref:HlyD family efflux transporter periplasmic adaptor subunit n=1 Tax=Nakamurella leprariae TaxID=2803911 RepID=A0A938YE79_9ACTN|nr:hypothetical protein [Nakamurella leprariae]MBM9466143.1 hypothetical protein [Nakamurella leprariae]
MSTPTTSPGPTGPAPGGLFRPEAVAQLDAQRRLDSSLTVAPPRSWLALIVVGLVAVAAVVWAVFGRAPVTVAGAGILLPPEGLVAVTAAAGGVVADVPAIDDADPTMPGVTVQAGQRLLTVRTPDGGTSDVTAQVDGVLVARTPLAVGTPLTAGAVVGQLLSSAERSVALLFIDPSAGSRVLPGMPVRLTPSTVSASAWGELRGTVRSVDPLPYDRADFVQLAGGNTQLAASLGGVGSVRVVVDLIRADTASGYAWTSDDGPPFAVAPTTSLTGSIELGTREPLSYLLGG